MAHGVGEWFSYATKKISFGLGEGLVATHGTVIFNHGPNCFKRPIFYCPMKPDNLVLIIAPSCGNRKCHVLH